MTTIVFTPSPTNSYSPCSISPQPSPTRDKEEEEGEGGGGGGGGIGLSETELQKKEASSFGGEEIHEGGGILELEEGEIQTMEGGRNGKGKGLWKGFEKNLHRPPSLQPRHDSPSPSFSLLDDTVTFNFTSKHSNRVFQSKSIGEIEARFSSAPQTNTPLRAVPADVNKQMRSGRKRRKKRPTSKSVATVAGGGTMSKRMKVARIPRSREMASLNRSQPNASKLDKQSSKEGPQPKRPKRRRGKKKGFG